MGSRSEIPHRSLDIEAARPECRVRPMWDIEGVASTEAAEDQLSRREGQKKRREEKRREEMTGPEAAR